MGIYRIGTSWKLSPALETRVNVDWKLEENLQGRFIIQAYNIINIKPLSKPRMGLNYNSRGCNPWIIDKRFPTLEGLNFIFSILKVW